MAYLFLLAIVPLAHGQILNAQFSSGAIRLVDGSVGNGSWASDVYNHPLGFQEVGGLGFANSGGGARSQKFGPLDFLRGYEAFGDYRTTRIETYEILNPYYNPDRPEGLFNQRVLGTGVRIIREGDYVAVPSLNLRAAPGTAPAPFRLTLFDAGGGSAYWDITPGTVPGQFQSFGIFATSLVGELDWSAINQFSIAGLGGTQPFHMAFDQFTIIPEPHEYLLVFGCALLATALWRRRTRPANL